MHKSESLHNFMYSGTYRPLLKCFDVNDLSLKFSRGLDADVVKMAVLSDDYSKVGYIFGLFC